MTGDSGGRADTDDSTNSRDRQKAMTERETDGDGDQGGRQASIARTVPTDEKKKELPRRKRTNRQTPSGGDIDTESTEELGQEKQEDIGS